MSKIGYIPIKEARQGEVVTVIDKLGGVSRGYFYQGKVWKSTGSYFAVNAKFDVNPMKRFIRDGGRGYVKAARRILGGS